MEEIHSVAKSDTKSIDGCELNGNFNPRGQIERDENLSRIERVPGNNNSNSTIHINSHFRRENSARSLKNYCLPNEFNQTKLMSGDLGSNNIKYYSDAISIKSWASVGMGSTDGKKMIVRRVPTSTVELFNVVNPPT